MKEKQKKKSGVSRLFEIAGEKKGLLMLAGVLSYLFIYRRSVPCVCWCLIGRYMKC